MVYMLSISSCTEGVWSRVCPLEWRAEEGWSLTVMSAHDILIVCTLVTVLCCSSFHWCPSHIQPPPAQHESVTGRRVVRVVLLNGRSVDFTVEVCPLQVWSVSV